MQTPLPNDITKQEIRRVWLMIVIAIVLAFTPDMVGWLSSTAHRAYVGYAYNIDDGYVYMSWARQTQDGHFFAKNLFTTDPQLGRQFNVFFLLIGNLARITHLPTIVLFSVARFLGAGGLLWLIYCFIGRMLPSSSTARLTALALSAFGTGLGWIFASQWIVKNDLKLPIDTWQPEAFTFLTLLTSSLFVISTLLIVGCMYLLMRGEQTDKMRYAVGAGACAFVLGNMHSYDVLHIVAAWGLYLVVENVISRRFSPASWIRAVVAGVLCCPTVAYQFYLFKVDPVFHARAGVATLAPHLGALVLGFGMTLLFAIAAALLYAKSEEFTRFWTDRKSFLLCTCWAIGAFALMWAPISFQRKMIMGIDTPLCILAGGAAAFLGQWVASKSAGTSKLLIPIVVVLLSLPSGLVWIARESMHITRGDSETNSISMLDADGLDMLHWIATNTQPGDAIVGNPTIMLFVPGFCDRAVWSGHWGETPDYPEKMRTYAHFAKGDLDNPQAFLAETKARYLAAIPTEEPGAANVPGLTKVYENGTYAVYRIGE